MALYKQEIQDQTIGSWLYAYGRVAALETQMISEAQMNRLFEAETMEEFMSLLQEFNYPGETYAEALAEAVRADIDLVAKISPQSHFLSDYLFFHDGHNLKAILKAVLTGDQAVGPQDLRRLFLSPYTVDPEYFLKKLWNEEGIKLPDWANQMIEETRRIYLETYDVSRIDISVDRMIWAEVEKRNSGDTHTWFRQHRAMQRDLINLETLLRSKVLNFSASAYRNALLPEGAVSEIQWFDWYELSTAELRAALAQTPYRDLAEYVGSYGQAGVASLFSKDADNLIIDHLRETIWYQAGPERVMAYLLARDLERKNIRIARACMVNSIPQTRAKSLMRKPYA